MDMAHCRSLLQGMTEGGAQAGRLSLVGVMHQQGDRQAFELAGRAVIRAVIDHDDAWALRQRFKRQPPDRANLVVGGDDNPHAVPRQVRLQQFFCSHCQ
jgi:hypothetical protein